VRPAKQHRQPAEDADSLLRDPEREVRRSAVFACGYRTPLAMLSSGRQAVPSDREPAVRSDVVGALGRSRQGSPGSGGPAKVKRRRWPTVGRYDHSFLRC
jgi:hypothetical protein